MTIRQDFEAWAGPKGYPLRTIETGERISYSYGPTLSAFAGYKEATSRQEAKIKALVECLESIKANAGKPETVYTLAKTFLDAAAKETP